jgi:imidazolonepropionase-like amidohydrolase
LAGIDPEVLNGLAGVTTASRYAPPDELEIDDDELERILAEAAEIERTLTHHLDRATRLRNAVDPRVPAGR